jgi:hypothetical protein
MLAVAFLIFMIRHARVSEPAPRRPHDLEAATNMSTTSRDSRVRGPTDSFAVQALDAASPPTLYKKLEADGDSPPDQSGPAVECVICLEMFGDQSMVRRLQCHHVFHADCINKWLLKRHYTCPLCMAYYIPQQPVEPTPVHQAEARGTAAAAAAAVAERPTT